MHLHTHTHTHTHTHSTQTISRPPRRSVKHKGASVATQTEDSISRPHLPTSSSRRKRLQRMYCLKHFRSQEIEAFLRRVPPPIIPSAAQDNYEPKPQDKSPIEKKSVWLSTLDTETCSRCIAIRPQVRLNRALSQLAGIEANRHASKEASQHETDGDTVERAGSSERGLVPPLQVLCRKVLKSGNRPDSNTSKSEHNCTGASVSASAVGSNLASDDHTGWTLLGPELQGLFKQLLHLFLVLKKLPVEHVLKSRASRIVDLLGHLLSHLPLPSRRDLTEAAQSVDDAQRYRMVGVSTWLFGFKLKELLQILECVKMDSSRLPAYFRAEVLQLKRVTSNTLNFVIRDLRHITVLHDASGREVLSSVAPPPFHSDQLAVPPLPPMENLLCDDLDDLDSSSSLSSLGSSESEEEEEGEGPYTAARVIPVIKYNTRNGHVRHSPTLLSLERKPPPIDATPPVTHIHRTPPSTSALRVQSPATTVSRMTPQQGQNTPVRLSTTSPITSHSDHSKAKLAILEHLESQIHRMLGTLSTRSSGQLLGANNSLGGGAVPSTIHQSSPASMLRLNAHDILKATSEQSSKDLAVTLSPTSPVSGIVCTSRIPPKQFTPISNILSHSHPSSHSSANTVPSSSIVSPPANSSPSLVGPPSVFLTATAPSPTTCPSRPTAPPHVRTNVLSPSDTRVVGSYGSQPLILSRGSLPQFPTTSVSSPASRTPNIVPPIMMSLAAGYLAMRTNPSTSPAPSTLPSQPNRTPPHSILSCPPPTLLTSTKPLAICSVSSAPSSSGSVASSCGSLTSSTSASIGRSSSGSSTSSSSGSVTLSHSGSVTSSTSDSVTSSTFDSVTSSTFDSVNKSSSGSVADVSLVSQPNTSTVVSSITITTNTNTTTTASPRSHEITTASVADPCPITASKVVKPFTQPNPPTTKGQGLQVSHSSQASSTGRMLPVNLESRNQPLCPPISSSSSVASRLPTAHRLSDNATTSLAHQGARSQHTSVTTAQSRPSHPITPISTAFPVPKVQVKTSEQGVVIKWTFSEENLRYQTSVTRYELYAYAVTSSHPTPPVHQWGKVGIIKPLSLPMAVTLTNFTKGQVYLFSVRAFFPGGCSVYSEPRTVSP